MVYPKLQIILFVVYGIYIKTELHMQKLMQELGSFMKLSLLSASVSDKRLQTYKDLTFFKSNTTI